MSPKLRVVLEKLAKQHPEDILKMLLAFEMTGEEDDFRYCCDEHPSHYEETGGHFEDCPLHKVLSAIGLPDQAAREAMRKELGLEKD